MDGVGSVAPRRVEDPVDPQVAFRGGGGPDVSGFIGHPDGEETLRGLASLWEDVSGYQPERPSLPAA